MFSPGMGRWWPAGWGIRPSEDMDRVIVFSQQLFSEDPQEKEDADEGN